MRRVLGSKIWIRKMYENKDDFVVFDSISSIHTIIWTNISLVLYPYQTLYFSSMILLHSSSIQTIELIIIINVVIFFFFNNNVTSSLVQPVQL